MRLPSQGVTEQLQPHKPAFCALNHLLGFKIGKIDTGRTLEKVSPFLNRTPQVVGTHLQ